MKIYSRIKSDLLLHMVNRAKDVDYKRNDISPDSEFLQVSTFKMKKGTTFRPHQHIENIRTTTITQESWIVIKGKVKALLYDIDGTLVEEVVLEPGDCSITFRGGHNYESMEEDSLVYEYKTGPYFGQEKDKVFI